MKQLVSIAIAAAAFAACGGVACAAPQMYKCIVGGRTVYQQQGCPVDAEPASAAPLATPASAAARSARGSERLASSPAKRLRPASATSSSVPATPR